MKLFHSCWLIVLSFLPFVQVFGQTASGLHKRTLYCFADRLSDSEMDFSDGIDALSNPNGQKDSLNFHEVMDKGDVMIHKMSQGIKRHGLRTVLSALVSCLEDAYDLMNEAEKKNSRIQDLIPYMRLYRDSDYFRESLFDVEFIHLNELFSKSSQFRQPLNDSERLLIDLCGLVSMGSFAILQDSLADEQSKANENRERLKATLLSEYERSKINVTHLYVDVLPEYPGGVLELTADIAKATEYPDSLKLQGISGTAYVSVTIREDGTPMNVEVVRKVHPVLDKNALKAIKALRPFTAGQRSGSYIPVTLYLPVRFGEQ